MLMKKSFMFLTVLFFMCSLSGCSTLSRQTMYVLDDNNISFTLPKMWEEVDSNENDLSLTKSSAELIINTYHQADLDGISASELLEQKIKENTSDMVSHSILKRYKVNEAPDRIIYSVLYSGTLNDVETQYFASVVEFKGVHTYVYVLYEAKEMYMKYNIDDIQRILVRMKWNGKEDLALN